MTDYKGIENERIRAKLGPQGLEIQEVQADGNCLFRACEHQLRLAPEDEKGDGPVPDHSAIRKRAAETLASNEQDYLPYLLKDDGTLMSSEDFKKYCEKIGSTSAWGGQAEIAAISRHLGRQIIVVSAFADDLTMGRPSTLTPLKISYHKHYYSLGAVRPCHSCIICVVVPQSVVPLFAFGQHYNSVVPSLKKKS
uniref:OTU domain-containing protein n=1 Tax=Lotharella oceanica TaxID=641309 RepID=A0A7S2X9E5_9EUKA